jgi:hypothetical protein
VHKLTEPKPKDLVEIAKRHFTAPGKKVSRKDEELYSLIADKMDELRKSIKDASIKKPSSAEYLDTVVAYRDLEIKMGKAAWDLLQQTAIDKGRGIG